MKRLVCLLVIVSIAYAGCADKKPSKVTVISGLLDGVPDGRWDYPEDGSWESPGVLRFEIANMHKQNEALRVRVDALVDALEDALAFQGGVERPEKLLLVRIADLEAALESQREVERAEKALLVRTAKLEAVLESQRAVIENLKKNTPVARDYIRVPEICASKLVKTMPSVRGKNRVSEGGGKGLWIPRDVEVLRGWPASGPRIRQSKQWRRPAKVSLIWPGPVDSQGVPSRFATMGQFESPGRCKMAFLLRSVPLLNHLLDFFSIPSIRLGIVLVRFKLVNGWGL